jgi:hypothetical protein
MRLIPLLLLPLLFAPVPARTEVWTVAPDGSGDYPTVGSALAAAQPGDTVELESGIYFEAGLLLTDRVILRSVTGNARDVTLDGSRAGRVLAGIGLNSGTRIEGLTIVGGNVAPPCADPGAGTYCLGAGLLLLDTTIDVVGCTFRDNEAADNGGGVASVLSAPHFVDCRFERNRATHGAGLTFVSSERNGEIPSLLRCLFEANDAHADGGALYAYASRPSITECTFRDNTCGEQGSAIVWHSPVPATIERTLITGGVGEAPIHVGVGAVPPVLVCCDLWGNVGGDWIGFLAPQLGERDNFSADPYFCGGEGEDVDESSPCLPGSTTCGAVGALEVGCSALDAPGWIRTESWGRVKERFRR